jgi:hypothetical protein
LYEGSKEKQLEQKEKVHLGRIADAKQELH